MRVFVDFYRIFNCLAVPTGFEPAISHVTGEHHTPICCDTNCFVPKVGVEPTELLILSQAALPVYPLGWELYFVVPVGIEPTPTDFQSAAIT